MTKLRIFTTGIVAAVLTAGVVLVVPETARADAAAAAAPMTPAQHLAEAAKFDQEAEDLTEKAAHHAAEAANYRGRIGNVGGKQMSDFESLAKHCDELAKSYREAAHGARALAESHRTMAN